MGYHRKTIYLAEHRSVEIDAYASAMGISDGKLLYTAFKEWCKMQPADLQERAKGYIRNPDTMPISVFKRVGGNKVKCKVVEPVVFAGRKRI